MSNPYPPGSRHTQRRATIQDVADRAAVSIATVSRVLNGSRTVNAEMAERVRAAMRDLEYQPNRAARTLAGRHPMIIGLLIIDMLNPFFMEIIRGVEDVAQRNGYLVILCNSAEDPHRERQYIELLCAEPVAGAIVVPTSARPALRLFAERGIPVVALDRHVHDRSIDCVLIDNVAAARAVVMHLIDNGYRRIGLILGPDSAATARERREGYRLALRDAGIPHDPQLERSGLYTEESAQRQVVELLDLKPPIEALFTVNNRLTMGALDILHARGLRVPEDIALVGVDAVPWAVPGAISVTTIIQPAYEMGSTAAARLIHRLQHPGAVARQEIVLAYQLSIGDSSRLRSSIETAVAG